MAKGVNRGLVAALVVGALVGGGAVVALAAREGGAARKSPYTEVPAPADRQVSYGKDVKTILEDRCYACHGDGAHKGGFKLDTREAFLKGGEESVVVVGDSGKSLLVKMVAGVGVESEKVMPPKGSFLTAEQIGVLRAWIDQGVKWEEK